MKEPKVIARLRELGIAVEACTSKDHQGFFDARGFLNDSLEFPGAVRVGREGLHIGDCSRMITLDLWVRERYPGHAGDKENAQYNENLLKKLDRLIAAAQLARYNVSTAIAREAKKESK